MARPRVPLLSREVIVAAALEVGGRSGEFTLRDLAASLSVKQASLYNHIQSKAELVDLMRESIHEDMAVKVDTNATWQDAIRLVAEAHRGLLIDHPWLIPQLATSPATVGAAVSAVENLATVLSKAGFEPRDVSSIIGAVDIVIIGASIDWFAPAVLFPPQVIEGTTDLAHAIQAMPPSHNRADDHFRYTVTLLIEALEHRLETSSLSSADVYSETPINEAESVPSRKR